MATPLLGAGDTVENRTDVASVLMELRVQTRGQNKKNQLNE